MNFKFLGHNCYTFYKENTVLIIDPWFSKSGAFLGSWFQWPINHNLLDKLLYQISDKNIYIYLTHEHQDHFDIETLKKFPKNSKFLIPNYFDKFFLNKIKKIGFEFIELQDSQEFEIIDGFRIKLLIIDIGINHDSAAIIKINNEIFINQNDCKIYDRLINFKEKVNYYSAQYSGATCHPSCFNYTEDEKIKISKSKIQIKINAIKKILKAIKPDYFLPSAGPAIFPFLDPNLSLGKNNIFVHQEELNTYLEKSMTKIIYLKPGDSFENYRTKPISPPTIDQINNLKKVLNNYWEKIDLKLDKTKLINEINNRLLEIKNLNFDKCPKIIFQWGEDKHDGVSIDLNKFKVQDFIDIPENDYFILKAEKKYFALMSDDNYRWQNIYLSLRAKIIEKPHAFSNFVNIFISSDVSNIKKYFQSNLEISKIKIVIQNPNNKKDYLINRYCPHNGGDLINAEIDQDGTLICPRHGWRFDLNNKGECTLNNATINAKEK